MRMWIAIIAIFCAGVGNFAMHRAFMESDDPLVQQMGPAARGDKVGPHITYVFEFLLLVGAMAIARATGSPRCCFMASTPSSTRWRSAG